MKNNYDFDKIQQKAPLTGKIHSRQGRMTSTTRAGDQFRDTRSKFTTTSEKIYQAQNKLKENKKKLPSDPVLKVKKFEEEIDELINQSNLKSYDGDQVGSLNDAKESLQKLKQLEKVIENAGYKEFNTDLYFSVIMNLANKYEKNGLFHEALSEYKSLLNAKSSETSFLVRVNMGNIFFRQEQYTQAIKMYKMSLDMAPSKFGAIKYKIMKNIGHAQVKKNEFVEAIQAYEDVMNKYPDFETAFNLILCLYTIGDKQKMKPTFTDMLNIQTHWNLEESHMQDDSDSS